MSASAQAVAAELRQTVATIEAMVGRLQAGINAQLRLLPAFAQGVVIDKWNDFVKLLKDVWDFYARVINNLGDPDELRWQAEAWITQVSSPVSGQGNVAKAGSLAADDSWDGDAAEKYRQRLEMQEEALESKHSAAIHGVTISCAA
jgi:hypothetical protein